MLVFDENRIGDIMEINEFAQNFFKMYKFSIGSKPEELYISM
jgi:hypothetical protein